MTRIADGVFGHRVIRRNVALIVVERLRGVRDDRPRLRDVASVFVCFQNFIGFCGLLRGAAGADPSVAVDDILDRLCAGLFAEF